MGRSMNRAFKVIWNVSRQVWMVTGELTRGKSKSSTATSAGKPNVTLSTEQLTFGVMHTRGILVKTLLFTSLLLAAGSLSAATLSGINLQLLQLHGPNDIAINTSYTNHNLLYNYSTPLTNNGTLVNTSRGTLTNYVTVNNTGTLNNTAGSNLINFGGGTLNNYGMLTNDGRLESSGILTNTGTLNNTAGGELRINNGTLTNFGGGTLNNYGTLTNSDSLTNVGTLNNYGTLFNYVSLIGTGTYIQTAGRTINNGAITQASIVINGGEFSERGSTNTSVLLVGDSGDGMLNIGVGGNVSVNGGAGIVNVASLAGSTGTLNIGSGDDFAVAAGTLYAASVAFGAGAGKLVFNHTNTDYLFSPTISGAGDIELLSGTTLFNGANTYSGNTTVDGGILKVNNTTGSATGTSSVTIANGGTLGGRGIISGAVTVSDGGILAAGNSPGTLTVGDLTLNNASVLEFELNSPSGTAGVDSDLIAVSGNLTLDGILNITNLSGFDFATAAGDMGSYQLFSYGGTLTDNTLSFGSGVLAGYNYNIDTDTSGQVLLTADYTGLQFWDGTNTVANNTVNGGSSTWDVTSSNWASQSGDINLAWRDLTAVFSATAGTVEVNGAQTISGLQFASDGYQLSDVDNDGELVLAATGAEMRINAGVTANIDVELSGTGSLTQSGNGTLILTADNTYSGGTSINSGTLQLGNGGTTGSITGDITNNSALIFNRSDDTTFADGITGTGSLTQSGNGTTIFTGANTYSGDTTINGGTLQLGNGGTTGSITGDIINNAALSFNRSDDVTYAGSITGAGSIGLVSGSTRFIGDLTGHTGTLTVDGGNLAINSNETLSLGGNYALAAASTHTVNVTNDATYSKLVVAGTATLASNAKININLANPNFGFTTAYTNGMADIISAGTLISDGTFAVTDNSYLFNFGAVKDGNTVDLTLTPAAQSALAITTSPAALGVAAAIDSIILDDPTGEIASSFVSLTTEQEVIDAIESLPPTASGGIAQTTVSVTSAFTSVIDSRQDTQQGISSGDDFMTDRHIWFKPFGGWTEQDTRQGVTGYDVDSYGLAFGFDGDVSSSWNAGFALAYINSDVASTLAAGAQGVDIDSYLAKVYATNMLDATTALNLQAGVGLSNYDSNRRIFTGDVASADYDSWNVQLSAELTRSYQVSDKTVISPYVHTDYSYVNVDGYSESGAGAFNLNVNDDSNDSLVIGAGLKGNHAVSDSLLLMANAGIGYDVMTDRNSLTSTFAGGGAQFTTEGIEPDEWVYKAGVGAKYSLDNGTEITASYNIDARQDYTDQSLSANFRMMF